MLYNNTNDNVEACPVRAQTRSRSLPVHKPLSAHLAKKHGIRMVEKKLFTSSASQLGLYVFQHGKGVVVGEVQVSGVEHGGSAHRGR